MKNTRYVEKSLDGDNFVEVTEATKLDAGKQVVVATLPTADATNYDVTLPDVSEARGLGPYTVRAIGTPGAGSTVTVKDCGYGAVTISDALAAAGDYGAYFSDGNAWYPVAQKLT